MSAVQTVTKLVDCGSPVITRDIESLRRRFLIMQDETLRSPAVEILENPNQASNFSIVRRLFVHVYTHAS